MTRLPTLLLATLLAGAPVAGLATGDEPAPDKLFESEQTLELSLTAPWRELVGNERYQGTYPATIEYAGADGEPVRIDLTVERRGVNRQQVCRIPPIRLRLEKGAAKGTVFRGQRKLKMVTHCQKKTGYEQYYVLEMLAYRIYNLSSPLLQPPPPPPPSKAVSGPFDFAKLD